MLLRKMRSVIASPRKLATSSESRVDVRALNRVIPPASGAFVPEGVPGKVTKSTNGFEYWNTSGHPPKFAMQPVVDAMTSRA